MVDEETVVEEEGRNRIGPKANMLLCEVKASGSDEEDREFLPKPVLASIRTQVSDGPVDCISKVNLTLQGPLPCWRVGVFEIRHVNIRTRIETINHHLPVDRACDFDPPLAKVGGDWSDLPVGGSNLTRLAEKIGKCSCPKPCMSEGSLLQQRVQAWREFSDQIADKSKGVRRQYLFEALEGRG